jgi:hypothetical protein
MAVSEELERKNVQCFFQRKKRRQSNASPLFLAPQGPSVLARRGLRRLLDALCQIGHGTRGTERKEKRILLLLRRGGDAEKRRATSFDLHALPAVKTVSSPCVCVALSITHFVLSTKTPLNKPNSPSAAAP